MIITRKKISLEYEYPDYIICHINKDIKLMLVETTTIEKDDDTAFNFISSLYLYDNKNKFYYNVANIHSLTSDNVPTIEISNEYKKDVEKLTKYISKYSFSFNQLINAMAFLNVYKGIKEIDVKTMSLMW